MADRTPRLLVVQPDEVGRLFNFEPWLADAGLCWDVVRPWAGELVPATVPADGLIVMGGSMSSLDDDDHPWLRDIRTLMRSAAEQDRPTLGVCLGAQLMAQAFGGRTMVGGPGLEAGLVEVAWTPDAALDPLVAGLPDPLLSGAMHGDEIVELPADAVLLGTGTTYRHQAFRIGPSSWGLQFHPEIDHRHFDIWAQAHPGSTPQDARLLEVGSRALRRQETGMVEGLRTLARRFASVVKGRRAD